MALEIGQIVDEKYRIIRLLGEGGMGAVYEGENTRIRRRVAIKVLFPALAGNAELVARFEREAQAAGQIGNDHILEVLDLGSLPSGERYMVLEYLDGETLFDRIRRLNKLTPPQIVPLARQFLSALDAAHAAGIIHRDLKPENIFILRGKAGRADFVKLIDFGVSKFANLGPETFRVTRAGSLVGTPVYMAPEQARGIGEADVRSDIYSVGVILYEAVTGTTPFADVESFNDLMFKIALETPPAPRTLVPDLDATFEAIILKCMARNPADRFDSVEALLDEIESWATVRDVPLSISPQRMRRSIPDEPSSNRLIITSPDLVTPLSAGGGIDAAVASRIGADKTSFDASASMSRPPQNKKLLLGGLGALALVGVIAIAMFSSSKPQQAQVAAGIVPVVSSATVGLSPIPAPLPSPPSPSDPNPAPSSTASSPQPEATKARAAVAAPRPASKPTTPAAVTPKAAPAPSVAKPTKPKAQDFGY